MTRPVNLYLISRIPDPEAFNNVFHHAAEKLSGSKTPIHEMESLRCFVDRMAEHGVSVPDLDGFFFSFNVPLIGKEFDLLKFHPNGSLNIELKSQSVPLEQIRAQLMKNRHYLSHLGRDMKLYTFVSDSDQCFHLTPFDVLEPVSLSDLANIVLSFSKGYETEIDSLFRPSEYIVSPAGTPIKFLNREYFLTQAQEQVRNSLLDALGETTGLAYFSLIGKPGTGKTLLLYDVGRTLSSQARTAILHWGELAEGHKTINTLDTGLTILSWSIMDDDQDDPLSALSPYSYVLVDEAHRLSPRQFRILCDTAMAFRQRIVFCMDPEQVLTTADRKSDIAGRVAELPPDGAFVLSERLRGNRQLLSFIQRIRDLNKVPTVHMDYRDVELGFASTIDEARNLLAYYRDQGYVFINYYRAAKDANPDNPFAAFEGGYDIHRVIGQEFDRVVLLLDNSFYYGEDGKLEGIPSPDPDILYPNLFYQSITRVQEKLALIVLENEPLFDRISQILA